jgi:hypothetical protein
MRTAGLALVIGVACAFAPSASAGVFPDLPGMDAAERLTDSEAPSAPRANTTVSNITKSDRVPTPDSSSVVQKATTSDDRLFIRNLPGGGGIPELGDEAGTASSSKGTALGLGALALLVVVLFTRFLVRLNTFGQQVA